MRFFLLCIFFFHTFLIAEAINIDAIRKELNTSLETQVKGQNKEIVQALYSANGNRPIWIGAENKTKMNELIQAMKDPLFNYKDMPFDQPSIARLFYLVDNNAVRPSQRAKVYARLDLLLTNSFVRLVRFIVQGDVDWALVQKKLAALEKSDDIIAKWEMQPKGMPDIRSLKNALSDEEIYPYLTSLLPMEERYRKLVKLLTEYRVMDKFPKVPYSKDPLRFGNNKQSIKYIKKHLQITGDYPKDAPIDTHFDKELYNAVLSYQKRYNLKRDGQIDTVMTYYLNQPLKSNIKSIITNLDKTKLYPKYFEPEHIEVNIPDFNLRYYKEGKKIQKMGVVVGRIDRPTPLFEDQIEYMVLNPTWTITDNLIKRDLIPVLKENPEYLIENNITAYRGNKEVTVTYDMLAEYQNSEKPVPYIFVQQPGINNALGRVKFMFPNKYSVYLHDTDNKTLLSRRYKIYSSGCMRVQKPFDLMDLLLEHTRGHYTKNQIEKIFDTNKPTTITLSRFIPVHITYFTVYEEDGKAYFKNDIYLYDMIIQESIFGRSKATFKVPEQRMISVKKNAQPPEEKKKN